MSSQSDSELSRKAFDRRSFLKGAGGAAAGSVLATNMAGAARAQNGATKVASVAGELPLTFNVNGTDLEVTVEPRTTLLSALRDHCSPPMTGTKLVCDQASCGACTVLVDGEPRLSCLTLARTVARQKVTTIEGVRGAEGRCHPLQETMGECGGSQCGFCTTGFVMAGVALLKKNARPSRAELAEALSGNLCRCTGYIKIFDAFEAAAARLADEQADGSTDPGEAA